MLKSLGFPATLAFMAGLALGAPAFAQSASPAPSDPTTEQSFKSLISTGFKVVATTFVPGEVQSDKNPVILVTLQKDQSVAVCTFGFGSWEQMGSSSTVDDDKVCDIRRY